MTAVPEYPKVWKEEDGIVRVDFGPGAHIDLDTVMLARERRLAITDEPTPVLYNGSQVLSLSQEAQRYVSSSEGSTFIKAAALLTPRFLARHLANMFMAYHKPPYPTRVFNDEAAALQWLAEYLD